MNIPDFSSLEEDTQYLSNLGNGVWLMDDHRWALYVWESEKRYRQYTLLHADYHWDSVYDYHEYPEEEIKLLQSSTEELKVIISEGEMIRYDSFIAPAVSRGLINNVHFYCKQHDGAGEDALDEMFLNRFNAQQHIHIDYNSLASTEINAPLIFDLCLDLFNDSEDWGSGELWEDEDILEFISSMKGHIENAELVTISLSFNYSGTVMDTRHLASLVIPKILGYRSQYYI